MLLMTWADVLRGAFQDVLGTLVSFVPNLVGALVFLAIGWLVAVILARIIGQIAKAFKFDKALRYAGAEKVIERAGYELNSADFLSGLVKWLTFIVFAMFALNVLGLEQASDFLSASLKVLVPQVLLAAVILIITAMVARFVEGVVASSAKAAQVRAANMIGSISGIAVWVMGGLTAFAQLGVDSSFVYTLFTGVVIALSLAFGLAFGLGGQTAASKYLEKLGKEL